MIGGVVEFPSLGALGVRLVVGQQTLDLLAEVRILDPQPMPRFRGVFCCERGTWKDTSGIIHKELNRKLRYKVLPPRFKKTRRSPRTLQLKSYCSLLEHNVKGSQPE